VLTDGYLTDLRLRPITRDAFGHFTDRTGEPFVGIERAKLIHILAEAVAVCRTGTRYLAIANHTDHVRIDLASGEKLDGVWAVLADGIRSSGRTSIAPATARDARQWCWRGVAQGVDLGDLDASFREGWGAEWRFGLVALGAGRTYWFVTQRSSSGATGHARSAADRRASIVDAARLFPEVIGKLIEATPPHQMLESRLEDLPALPRWHDGRMVCIGDAAHAMTPNLGQGATHALEDAVTLASMLSDYRGDMVRTAPLFVNRRKARTERAVRESRLIGALAHLPVWIAPVRNGIMRCIPRQMALNQLAWAYEYDDIPQWQTAA